MYDIYLQASDVLVSLFDEVTRSGSLRFHCVCARTSYVCSCVRARWSWCSVNDSHLCMRACIHSFTHTDRRAQLPPARDMQTNRRAHTYTYFVLRTQRANPCIHAFMHGSMYVGMLVCMHSCVMMQAWCAWACACTCSLACSRPSQALRIRMRGPERM
jgi:hypothetical protein